MSETIRLHRRVKFGRPRKVGPIEENSGNSAAEPTGRLPRVTQLIALAVRLERLLVEGEVPSASRLAELGTGVTGEANADPQPDAAGSRFAGGIAVSATDERGV